MERARARESARDEEKHAVGVLVCLLAFGLYKVRRLCSVQYLPFSSSLHGKEADRWEEERPLRLARLPHPLSRLRLLFCLFWFTQKSEREGGGVRGPESLYLEK